jgi:hypothetical protein
MGYETRAYLAELRRERRGDGRAERRRKSIEAAEGAARRWNADYPIGTAVHLTRDDGSIFETSTRTPAWALSSGDAVVSVVGISGGYLLSRVRAAMVRCAIGEGCDCAGWHEART